MQRTCVLACVVGVALLWTVTAHAQTGVQQTVDLTINSDYSANGVWNTPVSYKDGAVEVDDLTSYGTTGLMQYNVQSVFGDHGQLTMNPYGGGFAVLDTSTATGTTGVRINTGFQYLYIHYKVATALTKPVAVYEVLVGNGSMFASPKLTIHIPKGWKILTQWPAGTLDGQTLTITYPTNTPYVNPALLVLQPADIGAGNTVTHVGRFTLVGTTADVAKLTAAVSKLTFVDNLFQSRLGFTPPNSIVLYAADLSHAQVGYEAVALATAPNLILYNKDSLAHQSTPEIETTVVHEMTHLAEASQGLFNGATYIAPWFREGLAVFMENQARSLIYTDTRTQAIVDLSSDSHLFSVDQLKLRYNIDFDFLFQGTAGTSISDSYTLGGVVLTNFYNKVGLVGMQRLFAALTNANSSQTTYTGDSRTILSAMTNVSNASTYDELLFPYKGSATFATDVSTLVKPDYDFATQDAFVNYVKTSLHKYVTGGDAGVVSTSIPAPVPDMVTSSTTVSTNTASTTANATVAHVSCPIITRSLVVGSKGDDVKALQSYLIAGSYLAAGSISGTYGPMTSQAVKKWQQDHNVSVTGTVGPQTRVAIAKSCQ